MRHTQLHGLYFSLAQALLGQNAYASSAHSCQMGIKRGRKPAEGDLEDLSRTEEKIKASELPPRNAASSRQKSTECKHAEGRREWTMRIPDQQATRIFLQKKRKTTHTRRVSKHCLSLMKDTSTLACSFPAQHEQFRAEASHILRVHNEKLLRSFCCFATQYIAASCPKDADDFTELRETAKTLPDQDLLEAGMQNSFFPHMDSFRRDRSFYMHRVYKKLWGKELELSEPKLNLWFFLNCVFRYLGNHSFFTGVLLHPEWFVADRSISAEGLTTKTRSRVVGAVEDAFRLAAGSRRSVRSMFANLDGRRRTFGKSMDLVRVGADTRFVDHAVTALKLWAESALGAGRLILQMHHFLTADLLGQTSSAGAAANFASVCSPVGSAGL